MMKHAFAAWTLAGALAAPAAGAVELVRTDFDTSTDGWTAINGVAAQGWVTSGGDPGGFFAAVDAGGGVVFVYDAPAAYLGDQSAALGGTLSFSLKTSTRAYSMVNDQAAVRITGGGITLSAVVGDAPGLDWTSYVLQLVPGSFTLDDANGAAATAADLATVFAQVESLRIRGEYSLVIDRGGLDTVVLSAVPEPATWMLALAGAVGLTWRRRRVRP